jgi:D-3-phosphoglycerate dehydrogenase
VEYFTGYDNIDIEAASRRGVLVCHVPRHSTQEVPDHTLALILALLRKIPWMHIATKSGHWDWRAFRPIRNLEDMTAGIIGFGRLGKMVAARLKAFNLKILVYDPYVESSEAERMEVALTDLDTLMKSSDIVTVHTALTKETSCLIGKKELSMMKKGAIIVNASRGRVIDQKALTEALKTGHIAGAALDVLEDEPPKPDDPILKLDNVIITPHAAWYSEKASETDRRLAAEEALRILSEEKPLNPVKSSIKES